MAESEVELFQAWLVENGCCFPKLAIQGTGSERGVFATKDIEAGEEVANIDRRCLLNARAYRSSPTCRRLIALHGDPTSTTRFRNAQHVYLAVFMLVDRAAAEPRFGPYLRTLPRHFAELPAFWSDTTLNRCLGARSSAAHQARTLREELEADYRAVVAACPGFTRTASLADFKWARAAVLSRCFDVNDDVPATESSGAGAGAYATECNDKSSDDGAGGAACEDEGEGVQIAMVPLGDMLNHRRPAETACHFDAQRDCLVLTARVALAAGEQVFGYYGTKSTHRFLQHYGFVPEFNATLSSGAAARQRHSCPDEITLAGDSTISAGVEKRRYGADEGDFVVGMCYSHAFRSVLARLRREEADATEQEKLAVGVDRGAMAPFDSKKIGVCASRQPLNVRNEGRVLMRLHHMVTAHLATLPAGTAAMGAATLGEDEDAGGAQAAAAAAIVRSEARVCSHVLALCAVGLELLAQLPGDTTSATGRVWLEVGAENQ